MSLARSNGDYWIGLWIDNENQCSQCNSYPEGSTDCITCRQQWTWLDDADMIDELIDKWVSDEPTGTSNCGRIQNDGQLLDRDCLFEYRYICKKGMLVLKIFIMIVNVRIATDVFQSKNTVF